MKATNAFNAVINCILAPLALVGLFALGAAIDAAPDQREETANSLALQDAQRAAQIEHRAQQRAQALCAQHHGSNVLAAWTVDGALSCQPKRGPATIISAQAAIK